MLPLSVKASKSSTAHREGPNFSARNAKQGETPQNNGNKIDSDGTVFKSVHGSHDRPLSPGLPVDLSHQHLSMLPGLLPPTPHPGTGSRQLPAWPCPHSHDTSVHPPGQKDLAHSDKHTPPLPRKCLSIRHYDRSPTCSRNTSMRTLGVSEIVTVVKTSAARQPCHQLSVNPGAAGTVTDRSQEGNRGTQETRGFSSLNTSQSSDLLKPIYPRNTVGHSTETGSRGSA